MRFKPTWSLPPAPTVSNVLAKSGSSLLGCREFRAEGLKPAPELMSRDVKAILAPGT